MKKFREYSWMVRCRNLKVSCGRSEIPKALCLKMKLYLFSWQNLIGCKCFPCKFSNQIIFNEFKAFKKVFEKFFKLKSFKGTLKMTKNY